MWLGGYSRQFLRSFIDGETNTMTDQDIDDTIQWIPIDDDKTEWTVPLQKTEILFGASAVPLSATADEVVFDTGATFSTIPNSDYEKLLDAAKNNVETATCQSKQDQLNGGTAVYCRCIPATVDTEPWPVLSLDIGPPTKSSKFIVGAEHYFSFPERSSFNTF
jgi:hypothetical protein